MWLERIVMLEIIGMWTSVLGQGHGLGQMLWSSQLMSPPQGLRVLCSLTINPTLASSKMSGLKRTFVLSGASHRAAPLLVCMHLT